MRTYCKMLPMVAALAAATPALADHLVVDTSKTANALADSLLGVGLTRSGDATVVGSAGYFTTTTSAGLPTGLGSVRQGVILSSGNAASAVGPNTIGSLSETASGSGDADLNPIASGTTTDASSLAFPFLLNAKSTVYFNFIFASEEYNEWVNSQYDDVFALWIDGVNLAVVPATSTPISVNTVNKLENSAYYLSNDPGVSEVQFNIQYDGLTVGLQAQTASLDAGLHTVKFAISDVSDQAWDSAVFIQANTLSSDPTPIGPTVPVPSAVFAGLALMGSLGGAKLWRRRAEAR